MAHAPLTFEWLGRQPTTAASNAFEWLGQTSVDVPPVEVDDPPQTRGSTLKREWTRAEMIMIGGLVLNAIWLTLYARSLAKRRPEAS